MVKYLKAWKDRIKDVRSELVLNPEGNDVFEVMGHEVDTNTEGVLNRVRFHVTSINGVIDKHFTPAGNRYLAMTVSDINNIHLHMLLNSSRLLFNSPVKKILLTFVLNSRSLRTISMRSQDSWIKSIHG